MEEAYWLELDRRAVADDTGCRCTYGYTAWIDTKAGRR